MKSNLSKMMVPALVAVVSLAGCSDGPAAADTSPGFTLEASTAVARGAGIHKYRLTWEGERQLVGVGLDAQGQEVAKVEFARGDEGTRVVVENGLGRGVRTTAMDAKHRVTFSEEVQVRESGLTVRREKGVEGSAEVDISRGGQTWSYAEGDNAGLMTFMNSGWKADGLKAIELRDMALVLSGDPGVQAAISSHVSSGSAEVEQAAGGVCGRVATWVYKGGKAAWTYASSVRAARHACYAYMAHDMYCSLVEQGQQQPNGSYVCPITAVEHAAGIAACAAGWKGYKRKSKVAVNGSTGACATVCSTFDHEYEEEVDTESFGDDEQIYSDDESGTEVTFNQAYSYYEDCYDAGTPENDAGTGYCDEYGNCY